MRELRGRVGRGAERRGEEGRLILSGLCARKEVKGEEEEEEEEEEREALALSAHKHILHWTPCQNVSNINNQFILFNQFNC